MTTTLRLADWALGLTAGAGYFLYNLFSNNKNRLLLEKSDPDDSNKKSDPKGPKKKKGDDSPPPPPWDKKKDEEQRSRNQALNEAKDRANIPRSQQPSRQWQVGDDFNRSGQESYRYSKDSGTFGRYYEYDTPQGKRVIVEHTNDGTPHTHAGVPKGDTAATCYDFKENRYQKIIGPDGDHHIYYDK